MSHSVKFSAVSEADTVVNPVPYRYLFFILLLGWVTDCSALQPH